MSCNFCFVIPPKIDKIPFDSMWIVFFHGVVSFLFYDLVLKNDNNITPVGGQSADRNQLPTHLGGVMQDC